MNNRRKLVIALGAGALVAPLACFAQQPDRVWRVGFLSARSRPVSLDSDEYGGFPQGMRELGYVEGKNLVIDWRYAEGKYERLPELVAELVRLKVDVIVAPGSPVISAVQKASTTVPIVVVNAQDPVGSGLIKSLAHPGGNITGLSSLAVDIGPKHLEMLLGMVPKLTRVAVLVNFDNPSHPVTLKNIQAAAQKANAKAFSGGRTNCTRDRESIFRNAPGKSRGRHCGAGCAFPPASAPDRGTGGEESATDNIRDSGTHGGWRSDHLWTELHRQFSARRNLRGQNPQGCKAR